MLARVLRVILAYPIRRFTNLTPAPPRVSSSIHVPSSVRPANSTSHDPSSQIHEPSCFPSQTASPSHRLHLHDDFPNTTLGVTERRLQSSLNERWRTLEFQSVPQPNGECFPVSSPKHTFTREVYISLSPLSHPSYKNHHPPTVLHRIPHATHDHPFSTTNSSQLMIPFPHQHPPTQPPTTTAAGPADPLKRPTQLSAYRS